MKYNRVGSHMVLDNYLTISLTVNEVHFPDCTQLHNNYWNLGKCIISWDKDKTTLSTLLSQSWQTKANTTLGHDLSNSRKSIETGVWIVDWTHKWCSTKYCNKKVKKKVLTTGQKLDKYIQAWIQESHWYK